MAWRSERLCFKNHPLWCHHGQWNITKVSPGEVTTPAFRCFFLFCLYLLPNMQKPPQMLVWSPPPIFFFSFICLIWQRKTDVSTLRWPCVTTRQGDLTSMQPACRRSLLHRKRTFPAVYISCWSAALSPGPCEGMLMCHPASLNSSAFSWRLSASWATDINDRI